MVGNIKIVLVVLFFVIFTSFLFGENQSITTKIGYIYLAQDLKKFDNDFILGIDYQNNNFQYTNTIFKSNLLLRPGIDIVALNTNSKNYGYILNNHFDLLLNLEEFNFLANPYVGISPVLNYFYLKGSQNSLRVGFDLFSGCFFHVNKDLNLLCEIRYSISDIGNFELNLFKFLIGSQIRF